MQTFSKAFSGIPHGYSKLELPVLT